MEVREGHTTKHCNKRENKQMKIDIVQSRTALEQMQRDTRRDQGEGRSGGGKEGLKTVLERCHYNNKNELT